MIALGSALGVLGQGARFVLGMAPRQPQFQRAPALAGLTIAIFVGATAGGIGAVSFLGEKITPQDVVQLIALGYLGTDAIEQFVKAKLPGARAQ